ncbi:hypothetical protein B0I35DRAFT_208866 [Stachybotrys elegans]|uniref:Uncharacterized protein n=1 Tax=Stachybotrys elegans TaxID=80388 RepID=A0A8K0ST81_9HYPO|nr:hypothetical protein B0I35DRAFT_208866 [Stachybotrys elegans]
MANSCVLKIDRTDDESSFVLLQITPRGSKPLDLRLVATEGEAPYVATLKHDRVASLRGKNCSVSAEEWGEILQLVFSQTPQPDIQATATVESESSVTITIRKQIQGITQRLGSISLNHDPDQEIQLFDWCAAAADLSAKNKKQSVDADTRARELEITVQELKVQLEELVKAKQEDEDVLLRHAADLINEKKVKIREYLKVVEAARVSSTDDVPAPPESPQRVAPKHQPKQSRPTKRKASTAAVADEPEEMDVDSVKSEPGDSDAGRITDATASDLDSDEEEAAAQQSDADKPIPSHPVDKKDSAVQPQKKAPAQPPPKRDLPFTSRNKSKAPVVPAPAGSETESDDEL